MVSHNPQLFLKNNIRALELAFDIRKNKEQKISAEKKKTLEEYSGFGGISAILLPLDKPDLWSRNDQLMYNDIVSLHQLIADNSSSQAEQHAYFQSLKNSTLSAFYTPAAITETLAKCFKNNGITIKNFLDPCSGTGQFISSFSKINPAMSFTAFEKDVLTGVVLEAIYKDYPNPFKVNISPYEKISHQFQTS